MVNVAKEPQHMRRVLVRNIVAGTIYTVVAVSLVFVSRVTLEFLWTWFTIYVGPVCYLLVIIAINRSVFPDVSTTALRWTLLLGMCFAITAVVSFLAFVLAVNTHLALGGQL